MVLAVFVSTDGWAGALITRYGKRTDRKSHGDKSAFLEEWYMYRRLSSSGRSPSFPLKELQQKDTTKEELLPIKEWTIKSLRRIAKYFANQESIGNDQI